MKKYNFYVLIFAYIFISVFSINAYDNDAMDKIMNCEWDLSFQDLYGIPLGGRNLNRMTFSYAYMRRAFFKKSTFYKATFYHADLRDADLTDTDLTGANFQDAKMHGVKLDGAKVTGASFKGAKRLTNEQKKYLEDNGAINVPTRIEYALEEDCEEVGHEVKQRSLRERLVGFIMRRYKWYFQSENASTQTSKKCKKRKRRS